MLHPIPSALVSALELVTLLHSTCFLQKCIAAVQDRDDVRRGGRTRSSWNSAYKDGVGDVGVGRAPTIP